MHLRRAARRQPGLRHIFHIDLLLTPLIIPDL